VHPDASDKATAALRGLVWHQPGEEWEWGGAFDAAERAANAIMAQVSGPVEVQVEAWRRESAALCEMLRALFTWEEGGGASPFDQTLLLAVRSPLELETVCGRLRERFGLPELYLLSAASQSEPFTALSDRG
jgi:hypothetical protein